MTASFATIAAIVFPVFGLIAIGWGTARTRLLDASVGQALGDFVYVVAVPVLLFRTLATTSMPEVSPWPFWLSYFAAFAVVSVIASFTIRRVFGRDARTGVIAGVSAGMSNVVLVGLPFVILAFGEEGAIPLLMLIAVQFPLVMTVGSILVERAEWRDGAAEQRPRITETLGRVALSLARNVMILAILAGMAWRVGGLPLEGVPRVIVDMIAGAAVPCALFALGMSLTRYRLGGNLAPALLIFVMKLALMPALVWLLASQVAGLPPLWVKVAVIAAACPTGMNAWLIASRFGTGLAISANSITLTTAGAVISMAFWLALLQAW